MMEFDPNKPLVSLHVPKCAGSSFGQDLSQISNYYSVIYFYPEIGYILPNDWHRPKTIIHGHFVRWKNHAVEDFCPDCQYITLLRDPYDVCVSAYYYGLRNNLSWAVNSTIKEYFEWWLNSDIGPLTGSLLSLDKFNSIEEYCSKFICIGSVSRINDFYSKLERVLNVVFVTSSHLNVSKVLPNTPDYRNAFKERFPFDFDLYNYVESNI